MIIDVSRNMVNGDLMNEHGDERVHYKWGYDLYSWSYHHDLGCNLSKFQEDRMWTVDNPPVRCPISCWFPAQKPSITW